MRDDEDNIRQYLPVLRRIIILVAVLTAIPVVMWTVTAFVRSHVTPPRAPALQPMAIAPSGSPANTTVATTIHQCRPGGTVERARQWQPERRRRCRCGIRLRPDRRHTGHQDRFGWRAVECGKGRCDACSHKSGRCRGKSLGQCATEPIAGQ